MGSQGPIADRHRIARTRGRGTENHMPQRCGADRHAPGADQLIESVEYLAPGQTQIREIHQAVAVEMQRPSDIQNLGQSLPARTQGALRVFWPRPGGAGEA